MVRGVSEETGTGEAGTITRMRGPRRKKRLKAKVTLAKGKVQILHG